MIAAAERTLVSLPKTDLEMLVAEWISDLRVARRSAKTRHGYEQTMTLFMKRTGVRTLEDFTDKAVKGYLIELDENGASSSTAHRYWREIKTFVSWAINLENPPALHSSLVDKRPGVRKWFRVPEPTAERDEIEVFSPKQIAILEKDATRYNGSGRLTALSVDRRYVLLEHVLLGTGMRIDEALRATIEDLEENPFARPENDDAAGFIKVRTKPNRPTKTHKSRPVPVSDRLYRDLVRYIGRERPKSSAREIFVDEEGRPLRQHAPQQYFERLSARVGFRVHAHKFRHTFATDYLRAHPHDIERLRLILGHSDYKMIKVYVQFNLQMLGAGWNQGAPY